VVAIEKAVQFLLGHAWPYVNDLNILNIFQLSHFEHLLILFICNLVYLIHLVHSCVISLIHCVSTSIFCCGIVVIL
jgi:hypothetical protein